MPRQRSRASAPSNTGEATQTHTGGNKVATAIDDTEIAALLAGSKQRGAYDTELKNFIEGGEKGVLISLADGTFAGKKSGSVKTGFENARKRDGAPDEAAQVRVIVNEDKVYLVRQDLVGS